MHFYHGLLTTVVIGITLPLTLAIPDNFYVTQYTNRPLVRGLDRLDYHIVAREAWNNYDDFLEPRFSDRTPFLRRHLLTDQVESSLLSRTLHRRITPEERKKLLEEKKKTEAKLAEMANRYTFQTDRDRDPKGYENNPQPKPPPPVKKPSQSSETGGSKAPDCPPGTSPGKLPNGKWSGRCIENLR
jgi:hypothetical protein